MADRLEEIEHRWSAAREWAPWSQGPDADDARDVLWLINRVQQLEGESKALQHTRGDLAANNVCLTHEVQRLEKLVREHSSG